MLSLPWRRKGSLRQLDIRSSRRILENLRLAAEKEHYETVFNSIGEALISTDAEGGITLINPSAQNITGWKQEEALGKPIKDLFFALDLHGKLQTSNFFHIKYFPASPFGTSRTLILT